MQQAIFRAKDIFEMALGIEEHGIAFYRAARKPASPQVGGVLDFLIEQEIVHVRVFTRMRDELGDDFLLPESYPGERSAYINSFTQDQVFLDPTKALEQFEKVPDVTETIRIAIDFERRSILFYSWIKEIVRKSETAQINKIISEEHSHISKLLELRQELQKG